MNNYEEIAEFIEKLAEYYKHPGIQELYEIHEKLHQHVTTLRTAGSEREKAIREAANAAKNAKLPDHYQWGHDAMEQFDFGKERAELAILALLTNPAQDQIAKVGETPLTQVGQLRATARMMNIKGDEYTASLLEQAADTQQKLEYELNATKKLLAEAGGLLHHTTCIDGDATKCSACGVESAIDTALQSRGEGKE
jgi:hypothetical protein